MEKGIDTPLFEGNDRQKRFRMALWGIYLWILCLIFVLEDNLVKIQDHERQFVSLVFLLYSTYYFSCRSKGENFYFQSIGGRPVSKVGLLSSDVTAVFTYLISLGALIFDLLTK